MIPFVSIMSLEKIEGMIDMSMFGKRIKELRGKRTQEEVAEKIGISRARLSHFETGRREPDLELVNRFADFYGVTTDYLLGKSNDPRLTADQDKNFDEKAEKLLKIFENIKDEEKKEELFEEATQYIKYLVDTKFEGK